MMRLGVEVVVQCLAFAQKLRREQQIQPLALQGGRRLEALGILYVQASAIAHGDGTFNHHDGVRIHFEYQIDYFFHMACVEVVLHRVIIGRCGYHDEVGFAIGFPSVEGGAQIQLLLGQILFDVLVLYGADMLVYLFHFFRYYVHSCYLMLLRQ